MKVFELMNELSTLPAGATIICKRLMTSDDFLKCSIVDYDNSLDCREVVFDIKEVTSDGDDKVYLYD